MNEINNELEIESFHLSHLKINKKQIKKEIKNLMNEIYSFQNYDEISTCKLGIQQVHCAFVKSKNGRVMLILYPESENTALIGRYIKSMSKKIQEIDIGSKNYT